MLHEFLTENRAELIERCKAKVARRPTPHPAPLEDEHGVPVLIDQMVQSLKIELQTQSIRLLEQAPVTVPTLKTEIGRSAMVYGGELLRQGLSVDQVVHSYGDLCQAVTELAYAHNISISVDEFRTLNLCLDDAIAGAVSEFSAGREFQVSAHGDEVLNERLGFLAHELRNLIHTASLAVAAIKTGNVGLKGATGAILDRSLIGLRSLIDRSLAEVRVGAGMIAPRQRISVAQLIEEIRVSSSLEAQSRGCRFTVAEVDRSLAVDADREMLFSAVTNLLQNAFKFTQPNTSVSLLAYAAGDRLLIAVKDHCGGLPPGFSERFFKPFSRGDADSSGLGLGLSIVRRSIEANDGTLSVRDVACSGCVFTIDLPLQRLP